MDKLIIAYEQGYHNWYVSEFYKFFHKRVSEDYPNIEFEYFSLRELSEKFGETYDNQSNTIFGWFNFVIYNPKNEKMFVHSWYDYAPEVLKYSVTKGFNLVKFSCVSNLSDDIIEHYKDYTVVQPSVYYLENWKDMDYVLQSERVENKLNLTYFNGLNHGIRENILGALSNNSFFNIRTKNNPEHFRQKQDYYSEISKYKFGLSLNGAANICYRDLELFGLGVLNLRQPLNSKTLNPIVKDVHYLEFINDDLVRKILSREDVTSLIEDKVQEVMEFASTPNYVEMINQSKKWFIDNCIPENQYKILVSFMDDFSIFE